MTLKLAHAVWLVVSLAVAQSSAPADRAYQALRANDYSAATAAFREAIEAAPSLPHLRKDFAYLLLRTGEREEARDQFAAALALDPADDTAALEYAFLCYETRRPVEARRTFLRLKQQGATAETREKAAAAFENIDRPLREGIERWKRNVAAAPDQWSGHEELARLAEHRDELDLAAEHYREAWRLRPEQRRLLLDMGRVAKEQGRPRESIAFLLAASHSVEPRVAESARELLPRRYPYAYEFTDALAIDPGNVPLRREYAFLLLAMKQQEAAVAQLRLIRDTDDVARRQLDSILSPPKPEVVEIKPRAREAEPKPVDAKTMARRSYAASYLNDALRYYRIANEENPTDTEAMLGLGRTYNLLGRDAEALVWFDRARRAGSREADADYRNLRRSATRFHLTSWVLPMYSSRWSAAFLYGQVKAEWKPRRLLFTPYLSLRVVADTQGASFHTGRAMPYPAYLSETAIIPGVGVSMPLKYGFFVWAEAGQAISYLSSRTDTGRVTPDYRGGVAFLRGFGPGRYTNRGGVFVELSFDTVYLSRFHGDVVTYTQTRAGYAFAPADGAVQFQAYWNGNLTFDTGREYWANLFETGPGVRIRFNSLRPPLTFRFDVLRGGYLLNQFNPLAPNYWDVRAGVWYAFTR